MKSSFALQRPLHKMKFYQSFVSLLASALTAAAVGVDSGMYSIGSQRVPRSFDDGLRAVLSPNATVSHQIASAPRWSEYHAPQPGTIVHVATEHDVQAVVRNSDPLPVTISSFRKGPILSQAGGSLLSTEWRSWVDRLISPWRKRRPYQSARSQQNHIQRSTYPSTHSRRRLDQ